MSEFFIYMVLLKHQDNRIAIFSSSRNVEVINLNLTTPTNDLKRLFAWFIFIH